MEWYKNRKISTKLISGFILVAVFCILIGIFVITNIHNITNLDRTLYQENTVPLSYLAQMQQDYLKIEFNLLDMSADSTINAPMYEDTITKLTKDLSNSELIYGNYLHSKELMDNFTQLKGALEAYTYVKDTFIKDVKNGDSRSALNIMNGFGQSNNQSIDNCFTKAFAINYKLAKQRSDSNTSQGNKAIVIMSLIILLVIILAIVLGVIIAKIISGPIKRLVEAANKIADGNLDFNVRLDTKDEVGILGQAFVKIMNSLKNLIEDTDMLTKAAVVGKLNIRADGSKHNGDYRKIVNGINKTLDTLIGHIDILPSPVVIIDNDFNIQYMNKTGADLIAKSQSEVIGTKCYDNFKTSDCHTSNCACAGALQSGTIITNETDAHPNGKVMDIQYTGIPIRDEEEKVIGAMELIIDQTEIKATMRKSSEQAEELAATAKVSDKQAEFQKNEVGKLIVNLERLSKGDLNLETNIADIDEDTRQIGENFDNINNNLEKSVQAIKLMISDADILTNAAVEGKLKARADVSKHEGDYRKIIEGVNKTLDAIIQPVQETSAVLKEMASGNLQLRVEGNYKGDHADIKNAMNGTLDTLSLYINEISEVLNEMASSNLNVEINNEYKGDFEQIKDALNLITTSFNDVFGEINSSADQVLTGSKQVSYGSQALSQGATEQASSIEELTASINEVAAQTKENALNANQANELALKAKENAVHGNEQMKEMLRSMEEINEASTNISKIIKVIDDIHFKQIYLRLMQQWKQRERDSKVKVLQL
jgi:methyl-accepting chemotaxis protein